MASKSSKVYGLSFPTRKVKSSAAKLVESVFAQSDSDEEDKQHLKPLDTSGLHKTEQAKIHRKTKSDFEKAMEEDPTVFQYDEIYDDICSDKAHKLEDVFPEKKKQSRYIGSLIKTAGERKLERELCAERKAQKEIEAEKDAYADKEAFVTSAYKAKLGELRELVAKREEEQVHEKVMDITAQDGLGGFYRYMYQHGLDRKPSEEDASLVSDKKDGAEISTNAVDSGVCQEREHFDGTRERTQPHSSQSRTDKGSSGQSMGSSREETRLHHSSGKDRQGSHKRLRNPSDHGGHSTKAEGTRHHHDNAHRREQNSSCSSERHPEEGEKKSAPSSKPHDTNTEEEVPNNTDKRSPTVADNEGASKITKSRPLGSNSSSHSQFIEARPRLTTDEQIAEARQRYLARKAAGICPVLASSDSD